jgi:hypothetical protein
MHTQRKVSRSCYESYNTHYDTQTPPHERARKLIRFVESSAANRQAAMVCVTDQPGFSARW